jgi:hypothetical protein
LEIILESIESEFAMLGFIVNKRDPSNPFQTDNKWKKYTKEAMEFFENDQWLDSDKILSKSISTGKAQLTNEPIEISKKVSLQRVLVVPINFKGDVIGIITILNKKDAYNESDVVYLEKFSNYIALFLHKYIEIIILTEELLKRQQGQKKRLRYRRVLDEVNRQILQGLYSNGRENISNKQIIQKNSRMSHTGIKKRIDRLMENDILQIQGNINLEYRILK